jgi:hypothetical protein
MIEGCIIRYQRSTISKKTAIFAPGTSILTQYGIEETVIEVIDIEVQNLNRYR